MLYCVLYVFCLMKNKMDTKWIFTSKLNHNKMYMLMTKVTIFISCLCIGWQCGTAGSMLLHISWVSGDWVTLCMKCHMFSMWVCQAVD